MLNLKEWYTIVNLNPMNEDRVVRKYIIASQRDLSINVYVNCNKKWRKQVKKNWIPIPNKDWGRSHRQKEDYWPLRLISTYVPFVLI